MDDFVPKVVVIRAIVCKLCDELIITDFLTEVRFWGSWPFTLQKVLAGHSSIALGLIALRLLLSWTKSWEGLSWWEVVFFRWLSRFGCGLYIDTGRIKVSNIMLMGIKSSVRGMRVVVVKSEFLGEWGEGLHKSPVWRPKRPLWKKTIEPNNR